MKKTVCMILSLMLILTAVGCGKDNPPMPPPTKVDAPDEVLGYTQKMGARLSIADFRYGTEMPYDRYTDSTKHNYHARSFAGTQPVYSYVPRGTERERAYASSSNWIDEPKDTDCNSFTIFGDSMLPSTNGTVVCDYRMYIPPLSDYGTPVENFGYPADYTNYLNLSNYTTMQIIMKSTSSTNENVHYRIYLKDKFAELILAYEYEGKSGIKKDIQIDLTKVASKTQLEYIRFEQVLSNMDSSVTVKDELYYIEANSSMPAVTAKVNVGGMEIESEYLGNLLYTKWGAYSATGFYDRTDKKWKVWFGAGLPEIVSADNVYYTETSDLSKPFSKPKRIILNDPSTGYQILDPSGKLQAHDAPPGYGGDPSVIKVNGVYYMYFSALERGLKDDYGRTHWNKVYVATSRDAVTWEVKGIPLDTKDSGVGGYGGGSPSVVYYNGEYRMYYYTQSPDKNYPDEGCGLALKISTDGIHFGKAVSINIAMSTMDVKYIPSLRKWVGTYYSEENQFISKQKYAVRLAFSDDGYNWIYGNLDEQLPAQNPHTANNHNPGLIGNEHGEGYETMFLTYGANIIPLMVNGVWLSSAEYDERQLEWSRISIK